jgi:YbbR domain-containing protein
MEAPVSFVNLPAGLEIMDSPKTVSLVVEGQERLLRNLRHNEISAQIDLSNTRSGKVFVTITKDDIIIPKMLTVNSIDPETVSLKIESQLSKSVPVKPAVVGLPQKGFAIVEISVVPARVALEGPKSAVAKIYSIKTEPIDINGINADLTYKANLNLTDTNIKKDVSKVEVNITVKKID